MANLYVFVALVAALGVAHAGVVGVPSLLGAHYGLAGLGHYSAGLGHYAAGLGHYAAAPGLLAAPGLYAPGVIAAPGQAVLSNPGGLAASVAPGINVGADGQGPASGSALVGPTAVLHGSSATLYASTGAVKGHAQAGANLASSGLLVSPSSAGANIPAAAAAVLRI